MLRAPLRPPPARLRPARALPRAALVFALAACATSDQGTLRLVVGGEPDAWTRAPTPARLRVVMRDEGDGETTLFDGPVEGAASVELASLPPEAFGRVRATAFDAAGARVVEGETLAVSAGALAGTALDVFVQRVGTWARMPSSSSSSAPPAHHALVMGGRYVMSASGTSAAFYDLLFLREVASSAPLPRPAESLVASGTRALLIDRAGATLVDYGDARTSAEIDAPDGASFDSVAGGRTVVSAAGDSFVVGSTRDEGPPTARVLRVRASGVLDWARTTLDRRAACATHVAGRGLVVAGGKSDGPGAELLAEGAATSAPLPYGPFDAPECALAAVATDRVVIAAFDGSRAPRLASMRLDCAASCALEPFGPTLPERLTRPELAPLEDGSVLLTGVGAEGVMRALRVSPREARAIALPDRRAEGRLVVLPTGSVALVGGAPSLATFRP